MDIFTHIQAMLEFELIMQRSNLKIEFDEELILWSKAIVTYCKTKFRKMAAIQKIVKDVDVECKLSTAFVTLKKSWDSLFVMVYVQKY